MDGFDIPKGMTTTNTDNAPPNPLSRPPISEQLEVGVRSIDSSY